jgi:hypothetical protein
MNYMITEELKTRRINNATLAYNNSTTNWAKEYWMTVLNKLCQLYGRTNKKLN